MGPIFSTSQDNNKNVYYVEETLEAQWSCRYLTPLLLSSTLRSQLEAASEELDKSKEEHERVLDELRARIEEEESSIAETKRDIAEFQRDVIVVDESYLT